MREYTKEDIMDVMAKYPNVVSALVARSMGYFTPISATKALIYAIEGEPYFCEWYGSINGAYGDMWDSDNLRKVTREVLIAAIENRHHESDFKRAKGVVRRSLGGYNPVLASWF